MRAHFFKKPYTLSENRAIIVKIFFKEFFMKKIVAFIVSAAFVLPTFALTVNVGDDIAVAGKTGSAEYDSSKTFSHSWFTGFAPAENPEIAVTIIMEEAGTGSSYAVPVAKRVFDAYFGVE